MWTHAITASPGDSLSPTDYGWSVNDKLPKPTWFKELAIPDSLFMNGSNNTENLQDESDSKPELELETIDGLVRNSVVKHGVKTQIQRMKTGGGSLVGDNSIEVEICLTE